MKLNSLFSTLPLLFLSVAIFSGCQVKEAPKGSEKNPIQIAIVPSKDTMALLHDAEEMGRWLEKDTGLKFKISIPTNYIAVVEAMGSKRVDLAYFNTTTYILAHDKYGAEVFCTSMNADGEIEYKGQIIVRSDSKIQKLEDLNGKKIAYVDPTSASGYILPAYLLKSKNIKPSQSVFAGRHDSVVSMVYQKQVDAGATFYSVPENGKQMDARRLVVTQYPDVWDKIKVLDYTTKLANDAWAFRKDLPEDLKKKIADAMLKWASSPEGKVTLKSLDNASGLRQVTEAHYVDSKKIIKEMTQDLHE